MKRVSESVIKVGVGLLIVRGHKIVLGRRKAAHGAGSYATAGGHLEFGENIKEGALRELREEMGSQMKVKNIKLLCVATIKEYKPKHYVDIGLVAQWVSGEPLVLEPDKIESWQWFDLDALPSPLFGAIHHYIAAYRRGSVAFID